MTDAQEDALLWLPSQEYSAAIKTDLIEQLIALGMISRSQNGQVELTDCGRSVYLKALMAREA